MVKALKNHCWFSDKDKNPCVMRRKIKNRHENGRDNEKQRFGRILGRHGRMKNKKLPLLEKNKKKNVVFLLTKRSFFIIIILGEYNTKREGV